MLYITAIAGGVIIGVAAKGKLSNFMTFKFEKSWIILLAFIIQFGVQVMGFNGILFASTYSFFIQLIVFILLAVGFWFNRKYLGIWIVGVGALLNAVVMLFNGGKMPVDGEMFTRLNDVNSIEILRTGADGKHILISESSKLVFLSDIINPPGFLGWGSSIVSLGDLIVAIGVFVLIFEILRGSILRNKTKLKAVGV